VSITQTAETPISDTVTIVTVKVTYPGNPSATSVCHEIHCDNCNQVDVWEHMHHAVANAELHICPEPS
jgi:hypothetical protein